MRYLYSSIPVIAGIWTSAIRQAVSTSRGDARKSAAHEKASTLWPSDFISLLMESQKNRSSSTTETRKAFGIRTPAVRSPPCGTSNMLWRWDANAVTCAKGYHWGNGISRYTLAYPTRNSLAQPKKYRRTMSLGGKLWSIPPSSSSAESGCSGPQVGIGYDVLRAWHPTKPKGRTILRSFNCE